MRAFKSGQLGGVQTLEQALSKNKTSQGKKQHIVAFRDIPYIMLTWS